jgi:hypothetical protein
MEKQKTIMLSGMFAISFDKQGNALIQFVPDEPYTVEIDSILFEGSAQLLRSGQFEFVSSMINPLIIK